MLAPTENNITKTEQEKSKTVDQVQKVFVISPQECWEVTEKKTV